MGEPGILPDCNLLHRINPIFVRVQVCDSIKDKRHQVTSSQNNEEQNNYSKLVLVIFGLNVTVYLLQVLLQIVNFQKKHGRYKNLQNLPQYLNLDNMDKKIYRTSSTIDDALDVVFQVLK